ncbi:hypothetical protein JG687_00017259 [Phytophthora cactorum]|uniref:Peptidase S74 domain-containing protein n=1 Tax=Phytophthora cactorum TaxID=29920 RepID=A0A8T1TNR1_9STRA|nr:hypothetical protein JG687_00017259 [Phytophthora cactorum]
MVLTDTGRLGIGTSSPSSRLHCVGQSSYVFGSGGSTVYRLRTDLGATESALGPITYTTMSAIFDGYLLATVTVMTSVRRLKTNIYPIGLDQISDLYKLPVVQYQWKDQLDRYPEIGLIAQDVMEAGFVDLIAQTPLEDENPQQSSDPILEHIGVKLRLDYPKLTCYNMRMIQHLLTKISELEKKSQS